MAKASKTVIGWEEWCALPDIGLPAVKAKVDTGAKTSALHAFDIRKVTEDGQNFVCFKIHPLQRNNKLIRECKAPLKELRSVTSSNGEKEKRYVITTTLTVGEKTFVTDVTLTSRHKMTFRMLLGREALRKGKFIVDPAKSHLLGKNKTPETLYQTA